MISFTILFEILKLSAGTHFTPSTTPCSACRTSFRTSTCPPACVSVLCHYSAYKHNLARAAPCTALTRTAWVDVKYGTSANCWNIFSIAHFRIFFTVHNERRWACAFMEVQSDMRCRYLYAWCRDFADAFAFCDAIFAVHGTISRDDRITRPAGTACCVHFLSLCSLVFLRKISKRCALAVSLRCVRQIQSFKLSLGTDS